MNVPSIIAESPARPPLGLGARVGGELESQCLEVWTRTVGPLERMDGIKGRLSSPMGSYWLWIAIGLAAVVVLVGLIALLSYRGRLARRRVWQAFVAQAEEVGLSPEEQNLLAKIARRVGLTSLNAIFTSEQAFHRGVGAMATSNDTLDKGNGICAGCAFLILLREKLGFQALPTEAKLGTIKLAPTPPGTVLTVVRPLGTESFEAVVTDSKGSEELTVVPEVPVDCHPGESWVLRLAQGGTVWEFNALLLRTAGEEVVLKPVGEVRWITRRRFVRVPIRRPAYVASFPFDKPLRKGDVPEFVPAALIEIGGPGIQLIAPIQAEAGQRVLVILELSDEQLVESVGIVRRTAADALGMKISVELVGLTTAEINELAKATNLAAQASGVRTAPGRRQPVAAAAGES
jgi:hypothetical protein